MTEIPVVGGGIAGMAAALFLKKQGLASVIHEAVAGPLDRVCGEGILPVGVSILDELGLKGKVIEAGRPFSGIRYLCGKYHAEGRFDFGQGIGISRHRLHHVLREACLLTGVEVIEGTPWRLDDSSAWIDARGLRPRGGHDRSLRSSRVGIRMRVSGPIKDVVQVAFMSFGEIYVTPTGNDTSSVAFLVNPSKMPAPTAWRSWLTDHFRQRFPGYRDAREYAVRAPIAGYGWPASTNAVGDALCAFDPISGAGMSFALMSAKLVASKWGSYQKKQLTRAMSSFGSYTQTLLAFSGGGWRSKLLVRQLGKNPSMFDKMLSQYDGEHGLSDLGLMNWLKLALP